MCWSVVREGGKYIMELSSLDGVIINQIKCLHKKPVINGPTQRRPESAQMVAKQLLKLRKLSSAAGVLEIGTPEQGS